MAIHGSGLHHYDLRKRIYKKYEPLPHPKKLKRFFDKLIYIVVFLGLIANLPQLFEIWIYKQAGGVSVLSWFSFAVLSVVWMVYGILHKEKPIIFMSFGLIIIQVLIATGALIYG